MTNSSDSTLLEARAAGSWISGSSNTGSQGINHYSILFWMSLITHIIDASTGFQRPGFIIYIYSVIIIYAMFSVFKFQKVNFAEGEFFGFIILAYALPYLPNFFPDNRWILAISGIIFLMPLLPIYFGIRFPENSGIKKFTNFYLIFWAIILIFYMMLVLNPEQNTKVLVKNPFAGVKYVMTGVFNTIEEVQRNFTNALKRSIAAATGQPYEGEEESKVGIYIDEVKPLESRYTKNSKVYVQAKISAENIKEPINVDFFCVIEGVRQGVASPATIPGIYDKYQNIVDCDFGQLPVGSYTVVVRADFETETSSDIEYTFVNREVSSSQYEALGIKEQTMAIYSGGPVALGLPALRQPLKIDADPKSGNTQLSAYPFGVSLQSKWPQGKVKRGVFYILDVPEEISLKDCNRDPLISREEQTDGLKRNIYKFSVNSSNALESFDAVTCRIQYDDVKKLLGNDLKSVKTFAAKARYQYSIESSTYVTINEEE